MAAPADRHEPRPWYNPLRLGNLFWEGVKTTPTLPNHRPGIREKMGNGILYLYENCPRLVKKTITNPQLIITTVTVSAIWADSYLHYPKETVILTTAAITALGLKNITKEHLLTATNFAVWITSVTGFAGLGLRSAGRLDGDYIPNLDNYYRGIMPPPAQAQQPQQ